MTNHSPLDCCFRTLDSEIRYEFRRCSLALEFKGIIQRVKWVPTTKTWRANIFPVQTEQTRNVYYIMAMKEGWSKQTFY